MRIIFFAGKGGVGKTSVAAATGIKAAERGQRTVILSLDVAHSLADVFDLNRNLTEEFKRSGKKKAKQSKIRNSNIEVRTNSKFQCTKCKPGNYKPEA